MSDQLPEAEEDFTQEAAVGGKGPTLMPRVQTRAAKRAAVEHRLVCDLPGLFFSYFQKKTTTLLFSEAVRPCLLDKKPSDVSHSHRKINLEPRGSKESSYSSTCVLLEFSSICLEELLKLN